jgi:two-component system LytT family response regulator
MKTIIIEDEKNAQEVLENLLKLIDPKIKILGITDNTINGVKLINEHNPDIIFLDIHLKDKTGFDLLENLEDFNGRIIFITAHDNYALKAFKYSAFDYILKPINPIELKETLNRVKKEINKEYKYKQMLSVIKHNEANEENPKIVLKTQNNQYILIIKDIIRCESEGAYTKFITKNKKYLTSKNLKYYSSILEDYKFIRTHQTHLVNSEHIKEISSNGYLIMLDETKIPISTRKKQYVTKKINEFI